ncbi:MAG TPA: hypothetical protein DCY89_09685 [Gammaproteobacteria bacterium]|nr:hypothetical protein [Gammaproteobacteria bacterium]
MNGELLRAAASTSVLTLASRLLGFLRDALVAHALGAGSTAEAFVVAFRLPNLFRRLLAEGVLAQGLVPPLVRTATHSGAAVARRRIARWLRHATALGVVFMLAGPALAPLFVAGLAPGLGSGARPLGDPGTDPRPLAAELLLTMWPYLALSAVTAVLAAGLNARGWFRAVAAAPLILNLAMLGAFLFAPVADAVGRAHTLAQAVAAGAVLQVAWLSFAVWRRRRRGGWTDDAPAAEALWSEAAEIDSQPASNRSSARGRARFVVSVLNASVVQLNLVVATVVASTLLPGSLAWLYFAERLVEFPLALIAGGLAAVLLPRLTAPALDRRLWTANVDAALDLTWLVALPAAVGLTLLATPVVAALFQHGALGSGDALAAAHALAAFAPGVLPLCVARVLLPAALNRVAMRHLLVLGALLPLLHLALILPLAGALGHVGVALAATLTGFVQALTLLLLLMVSGYVPWVGRQVEAIGRPLLASLVMGVSLAWLLPPEEFWLVADHGHRLMTLLVCIAAGLTTYAITLFLLGWRPSSPRLSANHHLPDSPP